MMATKRQAANKRIGQRVIESYAKKAVRALFAAVEKPNSNYAYKKAVQAIAKLGTLAELFEDAASRNYRVVRLGRR